MADSLTNYLEKGLGVRLSEIIIDFIIDQEKRTWLLDVKVVRSRTLSKLWDVGTTEEILLLA
jgi:hypothetical protein